MLLLEKPPHDLAARGLAQPREEFPFHHPTESLLNPSVLKKIFETTKKRPK
jgi:hypothetical protein